MDEKVTNTLYISTYATGLGEKRARGKGTIGMEKTADGRIKFSIGRSKTSGYYGGMHLVNAWAEMELPKAHEMAMAILYLTGGILPCEGEGIQTMKHKVNLSVDIAFKMDLCSILNNKEALKAEVIAAVEKKLNELSIPGLEVKKNA